MVNCSSVERWLFGEVRHFCLFSKNCKDKDQHWCYIDDELFIKQVLKIIHKSDYCSILRVTEKWSSNFSDMCCFDKKYFLIDILIVTIIDLECIKDSKSLWTLILSIFELCSTLCFCVWMIDFSTIFFFFRLFPTHVESPQRISALPQKIWQCFTLDTLPNATYG